MMEHCSLLEHSQKEVQVEWNYSNVAIVSLVSLAAPAVLIIHICHEMVRQYPP